MMRNSLCLVAGAVLLALCGCQLPYSSGTTYVLDPSKIGTGEQAIVPMNDPTPWNPRSLDEHPPRK